MKLKSTLAILFASAAGFAGAADTTSDASESANKVTPGKLTSAERQAANRLPAVIADNQWEFLGGEAGWSLRQHGYEFRQGRVVHADPFSHDTLKPQQGDLVASIPQRD